MVASVAGQMSGQFVKPVKTSVQCPRRSSRVKGRPSWPVNEKSAIDFGLGSAVPARSTGGAEACSRSATPMPTATATRIAIQTGA